MEELTERLIDRKAALRSPIGGRSLEVSFKLRVYEGPLDLLLALIREAKIDIKDVFVSEITNQYIEYVAGMDIMDLDYVGEFIEMAATLLEISRFDQREGRNDASRCGFGRERGQANSPPIGFLTSAPLRIIEEL